MADSTAVRALAVILLIVWIVASGYYALGGYRTRKEALKKIEDEREGRYIPPTIKAEAQLPKSLEERLRQIAAQDAQSGVGTTETPAAPQSPGADTPATAASPAPAAFEPSEDANTSSMLEQSGGGAASSTDDGPTSATPEAEESMLFASNASDEDRPNEPSVSLFDAAPSSTPASTAAVGATATVAEALSGTTLPCDLVPLVAAGIEVLDPHRVDFITRGHLPAAVATALRDELIKAGFEFRSTGATTATAVRGDTRVKIVVHEHPSGVIEGTAKRFPSASLDSVVVEIATL